MGSLPPVSESGVINVRYSLKNQKVMSCVPSLGYFVRGDAIGGKMLSNELASIG